MRLIAAGLLLLVAAACTTDASSVAHRAEDLRPPPEIPPIERLGRWDGHTFVPVAPGSVTGGVLDVVVHGWEPGFLTAVRDHRGAVPLLLWDPTARDAQGRDAGFAVKRLAAALARRDPGATVLAYSWIDDAATGNGPLGARAAAARTDLNGTRLAFALGQAERPTFAASGGRLHLIGHSFGAKVATVAALALAAPPAQLTLLDSPENAAPEIFGAANHLEGYLPLLPIGRGEPGTTFVDSYFSLFGERYDVDPGLGRVVDVQLFPAQYPRTDLADRHEYPIDWYAESADESPTESPTESSVESSVESGRGVGAAWSPLIGADPSHLASFYRQAWTVPGGVDRARELDLRPSAEPKGSRAAPIVSVPVGRAAGTDRSDGIVLDGAVTRLWQVPLTIAPRDLAVGFDYRFVVPGVGDQLTVYVDGSPRLAAVGAWAGTAGLRATVDVSAVGPGRHTLTFVLAEATGGAAARVVLGNLRFERQGGGASGASRPTEGIRVALLILVVVAGLALVLGATAARVRRRRAGTR